MGLAGMQRATAGVQQAGEGIVQAGIRNIERLDSPDKITLSESAQAALRGEPTKSLEQSAMDMKMHQHAYAASAKVVASEQERFESVSELFSRHQAR
jgi:hypothetical protein